MISGMVSIVEYPFQLNSPKSKNTKNRMADKNKKRILQVFPYYFPPDVPDNGGGVKRAALTLISGLADSDFETYVMVPFANQRYDAAFLNAGAEQVIDVQRPDHLVLELARLKQKLYLAQYLWNVVGTANRIRRIIKQYSIDLVHSHASSFVGAAIAAKISNVPSLVHVHEYGFRLSNMANRGYYTVVPRFADQIVTCAEFITDGFVQNGVATSKVRTIYNGVDLDYFDPEKLGKDEKFKDQLVVDKSRWLVGFVGRFTSRKGVGIFIESALRILAVRQDIIFVVVGAADDQIPSELDYRESVVKLVEDSGMMQYFKFVGNQSDMPQVYASLDLLVFCSPQDMGPVVPLESMAMNTPVVVASDGGATEEIVDGETGIIADSGNPQSIAESILKLMDDRTLVEAMGRQGRTHVEQNFSQHRYVRGLIDVYESMLG